MTPLDFDLEYGRSPEIDAYLDKRAEYLQLMREVQTLQNKMRLAAQELHEAQIAMERKFDKGGARNVSH